MYDDFSLESSKLNLFFLSEDQIDLIFSRAFTIAGEDIFDFIGEDFNNPKVFERILSIFSEELFSPGDWVNLALPPGFSEREFELLLNILTVMGSENIENLIRFEDLKLSIEVVFRALEKLLGLKVSLEKLEEEFLAGSPAEAAQDFNSRKLELKNLISEVSKFSEFIEGGEI